jgi:hypothetical protein
MVDDGDPHRRIWWCSERWLPVLLASHLGCNQVQHDEGAMADPILHSDSNGGGWWWRSTMSRAAAEGEMSRAKDGTMWS